MSKNKSARDKKTETPSGEPWSGVAKAFVLFYASWCPFSQRFLPIFNEFAKNKPNECLSIVIDEKPDLCEKYEIDYYPTVLLFKKGKVEKRLDAIPGVGLTKQQLKELAIS
jgi:thiol-disulfide isomerase/thioredoxin